MSLDVVALLLGVVAALLVAPVSHALSRAAWVVRAPRAAVMLWQSLGVSATVATMGAGLCVAVARYHRGFFGGMGQLVAGVFGGHPLAGLGLPDALGLTLAADLGVVLVVVVATVLFRTVSARARHRRILNLLAGMIPGHPNTDLLDHAHAVAYCLPGFHPRIVISSGTLDLLTAEELAAVLDHERGHAREHHGLVMLPMTGLCDLVRWMPYARLAPVAVRALLEMAADDYSARIHGARPLAQSLLKLASSGHVPSCAMGFGAEEVLARTRRLLDPDRNSLMLAVAGVGLAILALAGPVSVLAIT